MPLDNNDPNIPLQAGNIQVGNPAQLFNALAQMQRAQQLRQQQQSENALRQLYAQPDALDPKTGRPTVNTLAKTFAVDPQFGMQMQNNLAKMGEMDLRKQVVQGEISQQQRELGHDVGTGALSMYEETLKSTNDEKLARQKAAEYRAQRLDEAKGIFTPDQIAKFPPFDPIAYRSLDLAYRRTHEKPLTAYQSAELGIQGQRLGLEVERFRTDMKAKEDALSETAQHHRTTEDISRQKGGEKLSPSKEIAVVDKDGNVVERFAARESASGPGWVHSDTGKPVEVPLGGKVDVGQAAGAVIGSRENVYIGRILEGGITATTDIENISKMPVTSSGMFGGRKQGPGLLDATKEVLANQLTTQDVQIYNSANTGIQRALAVIESAGLAPSGAFTEQFQGLTLKEGDTQLAKLYKLANARQIVENGMQVIKANPRVAPEQKKLADHFLDRVQTAIPWTTSDVIKLQTSDDPNATLHNLGVAKTGRGEATVPAAGGAHTESGMRIYQP